MGVGYIKKRNGEKYVEVFSKDSLPEKNDNCVTASSCSVFKASNYDTVSPILAKTKDSDFYNFELTLPKDSFTKVTAILVKCC